MAELDGHPVTPEALAALALTNLGHFTSMRVDDGRVRGLPLHLSRLVRDCRIVFAADLDPEHVLKLVRHAVGGRTGSLVVRVTVFDPALELGHPGATAAPHILVTTRPVAPTVLPALRVKACVYLRDLPMVKHVGLFGSLYHRRGAQLDGYDDALFTDPTGVVSEGATWNVGFFDGDNVIWPKADVLPGVTMGLLQQVGTHVTAPVTLDMLGSMQAAFATNTSIGVRPIHMIDGVNLLDDHPILRELHATYIAIPGDSLE
ncbi:branched-chain amino acid aminotransferase/4-amino-4-deoxychorismate lyase [Frankia casuarinae]|jgi:branched-subunit amino acid aminotransferase/4-amino-4-deoxychorismate lyase|uniref:Aminotransferase, class IV n=3 Tax=Frankia casuarinae (strain DSM 45818 / CECT 9043 / HFP020203 / CcI3) TaxID=106370 RepID=Q2J8F3_FRACC|nr:MULTISPECIES: aminotransferase class IV family protein [Frankia]ABD12439.1 aminotransferase, class IV [Frankia casuarinae]ETA01477.1 branched-chain amino acid aminotransferase/4-amino-4-deoxychorismate lyase [Frankia sp. CcI6]EYT91983.1 branched-chain amino acid aminotransferase/4-amino-4-deoxychorismate lyase [Frankia casuarinae]KDA44740.1 branched-chain amino acid aminotransferase/4-amino-4-deoxychorismate lyase [Frankia sp. BMG5.23]KEZ36422.1 branched-chain amino acid aminotransferase/4-